VRRQRATACAPGPLRPDVGAHRGRHLALAQRRIATEFGRATVVIDEAESPLAWLARRRGRDGRALIEAHQLQAGERLRADFTRANLMPHTTTNWTGPVAGEGGGGAAPATDAMVAARQRVHRALDAVGPEFAGLLLDVCCFLKALAAIERERRWPARSGKVVLQLALERLACHYGYAGEARGRTRAPLRTWLADETACVSEQPCAAGREAR
jgi:hypothetical protein